MVVSASVWEETQEAGETWMEGILGKVEWKGIWVVMEGWLRKSGFIIEVSWLLFLLVWVHSHAIGKETKLGAIAIIQKSSDDIVVRWEQTGMRGS